MLFRYADFSDLGIELPQLPYNLHPVAGQRKFPKPVVEIEKDVLEQLRKEELKEEELKEEKINVDEKQQNDNTETREEEIKLDDDKKNI